MTPLRRRRIYLMRHAQVRYFEGIDPEQVRLTELGRRQAEAAAAALRGVRFDRVLPNVDALLADDDWDVLLLVLHGAVNRAILSRALTGERVFLGGFEQSPGCLNVLDVAARGDWIVRAVNHTPYDAAHAEAARTTTMEELWAEYLAAREHRE